MQNTQATLSREPSTDEGTFGTLTFDSGLQFKTVECPWKDNHPRISCIPPGTYNVVPHVSPSKGKCFMVEDVPGRSEILFHVGNWAGDTDKGLRSDSLGCILVGDSFAVINGQKGVSGSRNALSQMLNAVTEPFTVVIEGD